MPHKASIGNHKFLPAVSPNTPSLTTAPFIQYKGLLPTMKRRNLSLSLSLSLLSPKKAMMTLFLACCILKQKTAAFVSNPALVGTHPLAVWRRIVSVTSSPEVHRPKLVLFNAVTSASSGSSSSSLTTTRKSEYPTKEEQLELLAEAVELRRLKQVEQAELLAASSRSKSLPKLVLCRASGYGDDLHRYEQALHKGHQAREALITRNMGLVYYCVKDVMGGGSNRHPNSKIGYRRTLQSLSTDDLIQEGAIGLSRAVDRWNPEIGGKFSTYAMYWIRAAVLRGIAERDDLVRVPVHVSSAVTKMTRAARQLGLSDDLVNGLFLSPSFSSSASGRSASWNEAKAAKALAALAGLSETQLSRALEVQRRRKRGGILSFETWMQQGKDLSSDHAAVLSSLPSSSVDLEHLRKELAKFLRPKEAEALSLRYGLTSDNSDGINNDDDDDDDGSIDSSKKHQSTGSFAGTATIISKGKWGEAMSFVEVGKRMHVSAEYGRRLCHQALAKLRAAYEQGKLEPSLLGL